MFTGCNLCRGKLNIVQPLAPFWEYNYVTDGALKKLKFHHLSHVDEGSGDIFLIQVSLWEKIPPNGNTMEAYGGHVFQSK